MEPLKRIIGEAHVAVAYGMEEAVFLDAIMFWYRTNRGNGRPVHFHDGRWWTYNSVRVFEDIFPWWNAGQIRRIIARCKEKGALLSGNFNKDQRDRTVWYSPSDALLELYGEPIGEDCICRKQQMEEPEPSTECDENGEPLPCSTHDRNNNVPPYSPPVGDGAAIPDPGPADKPATGKRPRRFIPPDVEQVRAYCRERGNSISPEAFVDYYTSKGWTVGHSPMKDWKAAVRTWEQRRRAQRKGADDEDDCFQ